MRDQQDPTHVNWNAHEQEDHGEDIHEPTDSIQDIVEIHVRVDSGSAPERDPTTARSLKPSLVMRFPRTRTGGGLSVVQAPGGQAPGTPSRGACSPLVRNLGTKLWLESHGPPEAHPGGVKGSTIPEKTREQSTAVVPARDLHPLPGTSGQTHVKGSTTPE